MSLMLTKGDKTRQFIIENTINLFSVKGYTAATMKDVCERCQMSRGGVYRHFSSTKEIFIEMLEADLEINRSVVEENIQKKVPAERIIDAYFCQEVESILSDNNGLYFAIHEFAFAEPDQRERLNQRMKDSVNILKMILEHGQKTKVYKMFDKDAVATHVIATALLEGARKAGAEVQNVFLSEKDVNHCVGCFACWHKTPGKCIHSDDMDILYK